jgi:hypothetical protein
MFLEPTISTMRSLAERGRPTGGSRTLQRRGPGARVARTAAADRALPGEESEFVISVQARATFTNICRVWGGTWRSHRFGCCILKPSSVE